MSGAYRFKRDVVLPRAQVLLEQLRPVCEQIEIAGSLRRGKTTIGDVELVAQPKVQEQVIAGQMDLFGGGVAATTKRVSLLDDVLERLVAGGDLHRDRPYTRQKGRWGDKMKSCWMSLDTGEGTEYIQLDLFIVTPSAQWGPILAIRTGPDEFNKALMYHINTRTPWKQEDGRLVHRGTGAEVKTPTEQAYFDALGLAWIAPADRYAEVVKRAVKRNGKPREAKPQPQPTAERRCVDDAVVRAMIRMRLETAAEIETDAN